MQSGITQSWRDGKAERWGPAAALQFYSLVSYSADPVTVLRHSARAGTGEAGTRQTRCQQSRLHLPLPNHLQRTLPLEPFLKLQDMLIASHRMCRSRCPVSGRTDAKKGSVQECWNIKKGQLS